jgi:hypothetical protein
MRLIITGATVVAACIWWFNSKSSESSQRPIRLHHADNQTHRKMDILEPKATIAPGSTGPTGNVDLYKIVYRDVAEAIQRINQEAAARDECDERFVVQDLQTLVDSVYSKSLTTDESKKCANIAIDALNVAMKSQDRLTLVHVDNGVKVAPSQHIMVPFLFYDVQSNSSAKLVVTLGQLVQDECDTGKPKHAIQQIAPFNSVEPHWNLF